MIYIIISNIGLALMMLIIYFRYSHFRVSSAFKIRDLEKRLSNEITEKESLRSGLTAEVQSQVDQVKKLLIGIDELRKEKEDEARLRLEAEKQIELALQKTHEIQKRMSDWKMVQDAAMEDSKNASVKVGEQLYERLMKNQKEITSESQTVIDKTVKSVYGYLDNISKNVEEFKIKSERASVQVDKAVSSASSSMVKAAPIQTDSATTKIINEVIENIKLSGHKPNKNYVATTTIDADKAKLLLCDIIFVKDEVIYMIDFKSARYFQEYDKMKKSDKAAAAATLKQRLDKYVTYISNTKYSSAIKKLSVGLKLKFGEAKVVLAVPSREAMASLKEIKYVNTIKESGVELYDFDTVNDLVL